MKNKGFFINAFALIGSTTFSQVITIFASIIEARIYSPTEMGIYSTYIAILAVLTVIVCFQYERAIVLIEEDNEAKKMIIICVMVCLLLVVLTAIITILEADSIAHFFNVPELSTWIKLLPISLLAAGIVSIMTYWNIRSSNIKIIAVINIVTALSVNLFQVFFGLERFHFIGGMIVGHLIGNCIVAAIYSFRFRFTLFKGVKPNVRLLKRYKQFPMFSVPSVFFDTLGANAPNLLLSLFFGATMAGFYSLGYRLLSVPVSVICTSVMQAFLPKAVESYKNGTLENAIGTIIDFILKIGLVPLLLISLVSKELIIIVFGEAWSYSANFIPLLCFWLLMGMFYSPISNTLIVLERQRDGLVINVISIIVKVISLIVGGITGNPLIAVGLCSIASGVVTLMACIYIVSLSVDNFANIIRSIFKNIWKAVLIVSPTILTAIFIDNSFGKLIIGIINGILFLCIFGKEIIPLLKRG